MGTAFTRKQRLLTKHDFECVFSQSRKRGVKIDIPFFSVLAVLNEKSTARIGFALSKKCMPHACIRNYVRRVFRENFRRQLDTLTHLDFVVLAKPILKKLGKHDIKQRMAEDLTILWRRIAECEKRNKFTA